MSKTRERNPWEQVAEFTPEPKSYTIAPTLNFPFYIEREWFGAELRHIIARVYEKTSDSERDGERWCGIRRRDAEGRMEEGPPATFAADGVLAALPIHFGAGRFRVRYYRRGQERAVIRTAFVTVAREAGSSGGQSKVTLEQAD